MYNLDLLDDGNFARTKRYGTWKRKLGNAQTAGKGKGRRLFPGGGVSGRLSGARGCRFARL